MISCKNTKTLPPVVFTIYSIDYPVSPQHYIQEVRGSTRSWFENLEFARTLWTAAGRREPSSGPVTSLQLLLYRM